MTGQLIIPGSAFPALPETLAAAYERAIAYVRNPHATNTIKAYKAAWERWAVHCPTVPCDPLPVEPLHLVGYLQALTERGKAPNTVRLELAALCALDAAQALATGDLDRPALRSNHLVQRWLKGWGKDNPRAPRRRAPALTVAELGRVLREAQEPGKNASRIAHAALYARDRAIITIGVAGGFRVNELCALELGDVELVPGAGVRVLLRRAKNDQQGQGHERVLLPQAAKLHCPAAAFEAWQHLRGKVPGPLFCPIRRSGLLELGLRLDEAAAMRVIVNRCKAAELERVTSHSLRATFYTLTKRKALSDVMKHVNSRSVQTALNYQRSASLFDPDTNPTSGLLDG